MYKSILLITSVIVSMSILSCKSQKILKNNEYAQLTHTTESLLERLLALMDISKEPYSKHEEKIINLLNDVQQHYENTKTLENTDFIIKQWNVLFEDNPDTLLITTYFDTWKHSKVMTEKEISIGKSNLQLTMYNIIAAEKQLSIEHSQSRDR